jgi:hypothetical protein
METDMRKLQLAAIAGALTLTGVAAAEAKPLFYYANPYFSDGTQQYQSRVIAGAAHNLYSTYIDGVRCHYEYRVAYGSRIRVEVCE